MFFGFSHQRTIYADQKAAHDQHEWEHKQKLIDQAKAEFAKLKNPAPASKGDDGTFAYEGSSLFRMLWRCWPRASRRSWPGFEGCTLTLGQ